MNFFKVDLTGDVISGHCKRRFSDSPVVFCVEYRALRIGLSSKELLLDSTSNSQT